MVHWSWVLVHSGIGTLHNMVLRFLPWHHHCRWWFTQGFVNCRHPFEQSENETSPCRQMEQADYWNEQHENEGSKHEPIQIIEWWTQPRNESKWIQHTKNGICIISHHPYVWIGRSNERVNHNFGPWTWCFFRNICL